MSFGAERNSCRGSHDHAAYESEAGVTEAVEVVERASSTAKVAEATNAGHASSAGRYSQIAETKYAVRMWPGCRYRFLLARRSAWWCLGRRSGWCVAA